jgi:hypothetical protein
LRFRRLAGRFRSKLGNVGDELKRSAILSVVILVIALGLLLPFAKWGAPRRPNNVPSTATFANGGKDPSYWIDCWSIAGVNQYSCTLYQPKNGETVLKGIFHQTAITQQRKLFYDGSAIHWKHGQLLRPLQLECVAGGQPPLVADCRASATRSN